MCQGVSPSPAAPRSHWPGGVMSLCGLPYKAWLSHTERAERLRLTQSQEGRQTGFFFLCRQAAKPAGIISMCRGLDSLPITCLERWALPMFSDTDPSWRSTMEDCDCCNNGLTPSLYFAVSAGQRSWRLCLEVYYKSRITASTASPRKMTHWGEIGAQVLFFQTLDKWKWIRFS